MAKRPFELDEAEQNEVRRGEGQAPDARELKRLQAVRLYGRGQAGSDIIELSGRSWRARLDWCAAYRANGAEGLNSKWQGENALKLSRAQRADLKARLDAYRPDQVLEAEIRISQGQFWMVSHLRVVVKRWYGVTYACRDSYVRLLDDCHFSQQQTEPVYRSQPDQQTVADFEAGQKKVTDFVQEHPQGIILAMDQLSLYCQATLTRGWSPVGQTPVVRITPNRDHSHFYGALDVRHGREMAVPTDDETTAMTVNFLMVVLHLFPTQDLLLLLDRAPWHFGPELDQRLAENDRLELVYFPPACPELNPQEPVWEQMRAAVGDNHVKIGERIPRIRFMCIFGDGRKCASMGAFMKSQTSGRWMRVIYCRTGIMK
jgi:transposase